MQKRSRPLLFVITTAGTDFGGPCREKRQDCVKILEQTVADETVFCVIFTIDEPEGDLPGDAWDTLAALEKAQPGWHEHVNRVFVLSELEKAKRNPGKQASYRTKYLDQWIGAKAAWMNMLKFQACGRKGLTLERMLAEQQGWRAFVGLDLASKIDLASLVLLLQLGEGDRARYRTHVERWIPEAQLVEGKNKDRYLKWREAGLITVTDGDIIDFDLIEERLLWFRGKVELVQVGYDPFQATQFATHMLEEGVPMIEVPMTVRQISAPMKEFEAAVYAGRFEYNSADDALGWQVGNVVARRDKKDNIFPDKERPEAKIDDVVATLVAMNRATAGVESNEIPSGYSLTVA